MNGVSIAPVGSSDWQEIGHLSEPLTFEITGVDTTMLEAYFGAKVEPPTHSVYMKTLHEVSGRPEKPKHVPGLMAWLRGTNWKAEKAYLTELFRWIGAGKPTKTVEVGTYIPKARIIPNPA